MRLTTKFSAFITLLSLLAMLLMLVGCAFSFIWLSQERVENRIDTLATEVDKALMTQSPQEVEQWLTRLMPVINAEQVTLRNDEGELFRLTRHENPMLEDEPNRFIQLELPLVHAPAAARRGTRSGENLVPLLYRCLYAGGAAERGCHYGGAAGDDAPLA